MRRSLQTMGTRRGRRLIVVGIAIALTGGCLDGGRSVEPIFGTVASRAENAAASQAAGLQAVTYEVFWDRLQPAADRFDAAQLDQARRDLDAFREVGTQIVLSLGIQYPPAWAFEVPNSRYVNQYGEAYVDDRPGSNGLNAVFNQQIRDSQAAYVARVFEVLGSDSYAVRLGWGFYGELSYPTNRYGDHTNAYWAFDDVALGKASGLAATLAGNPAPGWVPGVKTPDHASARQFATWYLDALADYQNWQIATVRQYYGGRLAVLYPSWGIRPGQLDTAIEKDLSGFTSPEQNGEIQRGHDFARHIASLSDRRIVVYTTWLDAPSSLGNDAGDDPAGWSPVHYLAQLAGDHRYMFEVWGENTGSGSADDMRLCFDRLEAFGLTGLFWAFEDQLYDSVGDYASIEEYAALIEAAEGR